MECGGPPPLFDAFSHCWPPLATESARGLAHSKTLRAIWRSRANAKRLGVRWPSTAFGRVLTLLHGTAVRKRQRTGALQDASRDSVVTGEREASWSAAALHRFRASAHPAARRRRQKAPEDWRTPRRFARFGSHRWTRSVLECGGPHLRLTLRAQETQRG